jgi:1,3-beta-glucanosyltransferase GAS1
VSQDDTLVTIYPEEIVPRTGYFALSAQIAQIQPTAINLTNHVPTKTTAPFCINSYTKILPAKEYPVDSSDFYTVEVFSTLPQTPNARVCSCMMQSLTCTAPVTAGEQDSDVVPENCFRNSAFCAGIISNSTSGQYGAYSGCNSIERASWVLNQRYLSLINYATESECKSIAGVFKSPTSSESLPKDCRVFLEQAGPAGIGTIDIDRAIEANSTTSAPTTTSALAASSALPTIVKIGIVVGVAVSVLLCASIAICCLRVRKRKKAAAFEIDGVPRHELSDHFTAPIMRHTVEMDGIERIELGDGQGNILVELEASHGMNELEASVRPN